MCGNVGFQFHGEFIVAEHFFINQELFGRHIMFDYFGLSFFKFNFLHYTLKHRHFFCFFDRTFCSWINESSLFFVKVLSSKRSNSHNIIEISKSSENLFQLQVLDAVNLCKLLIDNSASELVEIISLTNITNISKITSLLMCQELRNRVSIIYINFSLMDKVNSLKNHISWAYVIGIIVNIFKSKRRQD